MSRPRLAGSIASVALVLSALALAVVGGHGGDQIGSAARPARFVSAAEVKDLAGEVGHSIYWAGDRSPDRLELVEDAENNVYLRYLPPGTEAGDPRQTFLTVGTYPVANAQAALRRTAREGGVDLRRLAGGAVVMANPSSRGSTYLAYPNSDLEIEVYDPKPGRSLALVRAGEIRPVGE